MTFVVFALFLLFCLQGLLNYVVFQYFDYEHTCTWGKLFQRRVVSTELYIYVCIYYCAGCLQEGSYLIYVACAYAYKNYIQLESSCGHSRLWWGPCCSTFQLSLLCFTVLFVFVLCPVPNGASVSGLFILDCYFCFPQHIYL